MYMWIGASATRGGELEKLKLENMKIWSYFFFEGKNNLQWNDKNHELATVLQL